MNLCVNRFEGKRPPLPLLSRHYLPRHIYTVAVKCAHERYDNQCKRSWGTPEGSSAGIPFALLIHSWSWPFPSCDPEADRRAWAH
jgi:hypothetical protein